MKKPLHDSTTLLVSSFVGIVLLTATDLRADETTTLPPPANKKRVTYANDVRPLFDRSCFKCHGEEKQKGKLRLDSREATLKGAGDEKVIIPGQSAKSKLVKAVAHTTKDEDHWMPPEGKAKELTPEEISLVRAWIDQGAN